MARRAGDLNRQVHIERKVKTGDGQGGIDRSWTTLKQVWANGTPVGGKESVVNGTLRSSQPWRIEIRFTDVTVQDRIVMADGKVLGIQSVADPDGRRDTLVLFCTSEQK